jgi:hypothetical protein
MVDGECGEVSLLGLEVDRQLDSVTACAATLPMASTANRGDEEQ